MTNPTNNEQKQQTEEPIRRRRCAPEHRPIEKDFIFHRTICEDGKYPNPKNCAICRRLGLIPENTTSTTNCDSTEIESIDDVD